MKDVASRVAALYDSRFIQGYVRSKVRTDPVYAATIERLHGHPHPLVDVGCGPGVLAFFLREAGFHEPIIGIDFDAPKIEAARKVAESRYAGLEFRVGDVREPLPANHSVVMNDVLQYIPKEDQAKVLQNAARAVPPGGIAILRHGIEDGSWRARMSTLSEKFSRLNGWLKMERIELPTREEIVAPFAGFEAEILPLWGRTPFNNYLFVFRRAASSGITNE